MLHTITEEFVLLEDLLFRPAAGAIELADTILSPVGLTRIRLKLNLIDAILHAVERQRAAGAAHSKLLHRIKNRVRSEGIEELGVTIYERIIHGRFPPESCGAL